MVLVLFLVEVRFGFGFGGGDRENDRFVVEAGEVTVGQLGGIFGGGFEGDVFVVAVVGHDLGRWSST